MDGTWGMWAAPGHSSAGHLHLLAGLQAEHDGIKTKGSALCVGEGRQSLRHSPEKTGPRKGICRSFWHSLEWRPDGQLLTDWPGWVCGLHCVLPAELWHHVSLQ